MITVHAQLRPFKLHPCLHLDREGGPGRQAGGAVLVGGPGADRLARHPHPPPRQRPPRDRRDGDQGGAAARRWRPWRRRSEHRPAAAEGFRSGDPDAQGTAA